MRESPAATSRHYPQKYLWGLKSLFQFRRRQFVVFAILSCSLYGLYFLTQMRVLEKNFVNRGVHTARTLECGRSERDALLLDLPGCRIPSYDAFSAEIKQYVFDFPTVVCADPPPLVRSNDTAVFLERHLSPAYNASIVSCCYTGMWRAEGPNWQQSTSSLNDGIKWGNDIRFANECIPFEDSAEVPYEFIRVTCKSETGAQVYKDFHAFVPPKRPRGHKAVAVTPKELASEDSLSVLIVGMDSLSRLNMIRKMPRTRAFLEDKLGAVEMLGYNKIEDNTFPNLVPMLTSYSIPELRDVCWPKDTAHFDACPFVWKRFNQEGYVNMFAEDTAWMGLFHYVKWGFANQPTDYDPRPLLYLGESELGRGGGYNAKYCIGQRHQLEVLFNYGAKFVRTMQAARRKFFGLIWGTSLSHDMLNQPDEADAMYEQFLHAIADTGVLNRTVLIFMSDHGLRFGSILSTSQGHQENLMPAMYYVLPEWVRRRYPQAMRTLECNQRRLVTGFDLHVTLHNFMDLHSLEDERLSVVASQVQRAFNSTAIKPPRGISLFVPIPEERTCQDAGIPDNYCACQRLDVADPRSPGVQRAADFVVEQVNAMLAGHFQGQTGPVGCARLSLGSVQRAERGSPPSRVINEEAREDEYLVQLRTEPGAALLSATVRHHLKSDTMKLAGSVSRLDAYGNSSWCVNSQPLKPLCHCIAPAPTTTTTTPVPVHATPAPTTPRARG